MPADGRTPRTGAHRARHIYRTSLRLCSALCSKEFRKTKDRLFREKMKRKEGKKVPYVRRQAFFPPISYSHQSLTGSKVEESSVVRHQRRRRPVSPLQYQFQFQFQYPTPDASCFCANTCPSHCIPFEENPKRSHISYTQRPQPGPVLWARPRSRETRACCSFPPAVLCYHPVRLREGELGLEPLRCFNATSAASSLALLTYCPSYQYRAAMF
jgi:hypothetical protein